MVLKDEIRDRFQDNLERVRRMVEAYEAGAGKGRGSDPLTRNQVISMTFPEKLTAALKELEKEDNLKELSVEVIPSDNYRFVAIVTSDSFEEIPDYIRQDLVWGKVLEKFDDYEQRLVEFIDTPA